MFLWHQKNIVFNFLPSFLVYLKDCSIACFSATADA